MYSGQWFNFALLNLLERVSKKGEKCEVFRSPQSLSLSRRFLGEHKHPIPHSTQLSSACALKIGKVEARVATHKNDFPILRPKNLINYKISCALHIPVVVYFSGVID